MRSRFRLALLLLSAAAVLPLHGQSLRGRVLMPDSAAPAPGILLSVNDASGRAIARAVSGASGGFAIPLPGAGTYTLRALKIGYLPRTIDGLAVAAGEARTIDVRLALAPVPLDAIRITADDECIPAGADGIRFLDLVDKSRNALALAHVAERTGPIELRVLRMRGVVDRKGLRDDVDSVRVEELFLDQLPRQAPRDSLLTFGFIRLGADGAIRYELPHPDLVFSDDFLSSHCFRPVDGPRDYRTLYGIAFWPAMVHDSAADIDGTIWIDRATSELRRIDFAYMNVREMKAAVCHASNDKTARGFCRERSDLSLATGGYVAYKTLSTGEWLPFDWVLRTPPTPPADATKSYHADGLVSTHITVASLTRGGQTLYTDVPASVAFSRMASRRAGRHPATLLGDVTDDAGQPVASAVVQLTDPSRIAVTDSAGRFMFSPLPADTMQIEVRSASLGVATTRIPLVGDSIKQVRIRFKKPE